ncbi:FeoA family protein [Clostridium culturomicium]|uniref:FeoA family protein n=1 Tax=Clostridium culturomicium TaxID=1499683 RepID=UPI000A7428A0|nr:FeoA family protein [Clostridium culturomicium]
MEGVLKRSFFSRIMGMADRDSVVKNLSQGKINRNYRIEAIKSSDEELTNFLFSLGCYEGEVITLISVICDNYVINIKDARYSIDKELASAVMVEEI